MIVWLLQKLQSLEEDRKWVFDFAQDVKQSGAAGNEWRLGNCCLGRLVYL